MISSDVDHHHILYETPLMRKLPDSELLRPAEIRTSVSLLHGEDLRSVPGGLREVSSTQAAAVPSIFSLLGLFSIALFGSQ